MVVKNCHGIRVCKTGKYSVQKLYSARQITLSYIMILYVFSLWKLYVVKMFIPYFVIYLQYLPTIAVEFVLPMIGLLQE
jgi:hypothetical protein